MSASGPSSSMKLNSSFITEEKKEREQGMLDIRTLREKSKNLDLPLISALCNDRHLLKQTKAFVMPKHPIIDDNNSGSSRCTNINGNGTSNKNKFPVSGLSSTQIAKTSIKKALTSSHRHPSDIVKTNNAFKVNPPTTRIMAQKDLTRASHS